VEELLGDIRRQDYPQTKLEIVIIDDGSDEPYLLSDQEVQVIRHESSQGAQRSRNEGLEAACGEIALIVDDDIELVDNDFISKAMEIFRRYPRVAAVVSRKIDVLKIKAQEKLLEYSTSRPTFYSGDLINQPNSEGPTKWGHGIYFVRREVLLNIGGYDGIYGLNGGHSFREESDVHGRLRQNGYIIWYLPTITIKHHIVQSGGHGGSTGKRLFWIAHNHIVFIRRYLSWWPLRGVGFLIDVFRYSWVQGRFRYIIIMLGGYIAGWIDALRDRGPGRNLWLEQ